MWMPSSGWVPCVNWNERGKRKMDNTKKISMSIGEKCLLDNLKRNIMSTGAAMPSDIHLLKIIREECPGLNNPPK